MSQFFLSNHVHVCVAGDHLIFLDLRSDKYIALPTLQGRGLTALIRDWPVVEAGKADAEPADPSSTAIVQEMTRRNLLTSDPSFGKRPVPIAVETPSIALLEDSLEGTAPNVRLHHVSAFFWASTKAATRLRWQSIERTVQAVKRRKDEHVHERHTLNVELARELVGVFYALRPFLFTSRGACLFDSLALVEFMTIYNIFPTWVFGVQAIPFAAHCWIQDGAIVFNDSVDHVRNYTAIMAV